MNSCREFGFLKQFLVLAKDDCGEAHIYNKKKRTTPTSTSLVFPSMITMQADTRFCYIDRHPET